MGLLDDNTYIFRLVVPVFQLFHNFRFGNNEFEVYHTGQRYGLGCTRLASKPEKPPNKETEELGITIARLPQMKEGTAQVPLEGCTSGVNRNGGGGLSGCGWIS